MLNPLARATSPRTPKTKIAHVPQNVTISSARLLSDAPPNCATVKAMPPNAPSGAAHMMSRMIAEDHPRGGLEDADDPLALDPREGRDRGRREEGEDEDLEDLVVDEGLQEARRQQVAGDERDDAGVGPGLGDRLLRRLAAGRADRPLKPEPGSTMLAASRPSVSATTVAQKK